MPVGDPGKEEFRDAVTKDLRNLHIAAGLAPVMDFRSEVIGNDELNFRGGMDSGTRDHQLRLLLWCDRWRRRVTLNPDPASLEEQVENAIETEIDLTDSENPFAGDNIQNMSGSLYDLPWALDGTNPNIPLVSQLDIKNNQAIVFLGAINRTIVLWTRMNSRGRSKFITRMDSTRIYGNYQELFGFLVAFGGAANMIDIAQMLPTDEPRGPQASSNVSNELGSDGT